MKCIVIIPVYNKENTIERCIRSVSDQTYPIEILAVNDGSTDSCGTLLESIELDNFTFLHQENKGVSAARNLGLQYALEHDYEHLFLLDADDYWLPNHVETHIALSQEFPDATAFGSNYSKINADHIEKTKFSGFTNNENQVLDQFFNNNFLNSIFLSSNVSFKSSLLEDTGLFRPQITHAEDTDFFIRVGVHSKVVFSHQITAMIDVSADNRSDLVNMDHRNYPDFTAYEAFCPDHVGLKKYLDLNYYAIALLYRMENKVDKAQEYEQLINFKNLSFKQRQLLKLSGNSLRYLKEVQIYLQRKGMRLRSGS
jgi:glycosyltransferase involved in cell wall biosynthesis